ncbi:MAG: c-type cytochrome [Deltaproteobacteria bacterium]|nr:c-type cytochrome [Deltaproteobacteria bacterium]
MIYIKKEGFLKGGAVMRNVVFLCFLVITFLAAGSALSQERLPLGLPPVPIPEDNPQTKEKIALGKKLYEDKRFSADGTVSCATCHDSAKAFGDGLPVAEGINKLKGTRNSPTVINAAYYTSQFWDGRRPSLEEQAKDPFLNPVEHGLGKEQNFHQFIIDIIRKDPDYPKAFRQVFGVDKKGITIDHVVKAIASFERTVISGNSPFDRYKYGGDQNALSESAKRGLGLYLGKARCQECHMISEKYALFTDNKFHNLGVGFNKIRPKLRKLVKEVKMSQKKGKAMDESILTKSDVSELGRFVITGKTSELGAFKTPTLRNIAVTGPYMHDGSMATLEEVMELYNKGGEKNPFLGSVRVLNLTDQEIKDIIAFLESLTSPEFADLDKK